MTDRRYSRFRYGSGTLYGPSDATNALAYGVQVDWDDDKTFDGANEAGHMIGWSMFRGRKSLFRSTGQGYEPIQTGSLTVVFDNADGRYDGWNTSSPLYGLVTSGKEFKFTIRDLSTGGATYNIFRGQVSNPTVSGAGANAIMTMTCEDGLRYLRTYGGAVALQQNISPDAAVGKVLDAVNWPLRWGRSLNAFSDVIKYWWTQGSKKAGPEIEDLANAYLSYFYTDNIGRARLLSRTNVSASVCDYYEDQLLKNIDLPQPATNKFNVVSIKTHPRTAATTGTIYQMQGDTPAIQPGAANALTIFVNYSYGGVAVPAKNVVTPVASTDWKTNASPDGLGTDKTANCTLAFTDLGDRAICTWTNNDAAAVYLTLAKVRGEAVYEGGAADATYPSNTSTVIEQRQFILDLVQQQDANAAVSFCGVLGPWISVDHPFPVIRIENRPALQYTPDLFDIVTLDAPKKGIYGVAFRVGGIEHRSDPAIKNCQRVTTTLYLEPYISAEDFWRWDTASVFDTSTVFAY